MAEVISKQSLNRHNIDKYSFKVLAIGQPKKKPPLHTFGKENVLKEPIEERSQPDVTPSNDAQHKNSESSKDSLIESLLKKTDEMSSNFIKLQMKLEAMQEEHKHELEQIRQSAFEEGRLKGKEEAKKECDERYESTLNLFADSISKLESKASEYNSALENVKKELTGAAVEIAREVVNVELNEHSEKIAAALAESLIEELKEASKVTLKVNPKDFSFVAQKLQELEHVKVVADAAISEGGVVAVSDIENIDAQIPSRFEKVKRVILSE